MVCYIIFLLAAGCSYKQWKLITLGIERLRHGYHELKTSIYLYSLGSSHHSDIDCGGHGDQANFLSHFADQNEQLGRLTQQNDHLKEDMEKLKVSLLILME